MNRETIDRLRATAERHIDEQEPYTARFVAELLAEMGRQLDEIERLGALVKSFQGEPKPKWPRVVALSHHHSRDVRLVFTGTDFKMEKQWSDAMGERIWTNEDVEHDGDGRIDSGSVLYALVYALAFGEGAP